MRTEKWIPTSQFADMLGVDPATARRSLCTRGHYLGIKPTKLPNGRLLWPKAEADDLLKDSMAQQSQAAQGVFMQDIQPLFAPKSPQARLSCLRYTRQMLKKKYRDDRENRDAWQEFDALLASQEAAALNELRRSHA